MRPIRLHHLLHTSRVATYCCIELSLLQTVQHIKTSGQVGHIHVLLNYILTP